MRVNTPQFVDLIKNFFATKPREVEGLTNISAEYYRTYMLKKLFAIFKVGGVPYNWDMDYFWTHLFLDGVICITDTEVGVVPLKTGTTGLNFYDHPTECVITNYVLGDFTRKIDIDCALVKLQFDFGSVNSMLDRYAYLLAACDSSVAVNLMNSKVAFIGEADSKAQAESLMAMYDQIAMGKPAVFKKSSGGETSWQLMNVKNTFIADVVQDVRRTLINDFLTEIGIMNYNMGKKARLNMEEVHGNDMEIYCNVAHWLECISAGFDVANRLFGLNLTIERNTFEYMMSKAEREALGDSAKNTARSVTKEQATNEKEGIG